MTDQIREQVSALLDGELPQGEIGLLVRRMERDPELRRAFGSYSLIGELLRAPGGHTARPSFASRVSEAIAAPEQQPAAGVAKVPERAFWKRPGFATAIAASAALAAIVLVRPDAQHRNAIVASQTAAEALGALPLAGATSPTPAQSQRLASYLVAHSQFSSALGRHNVWSGLLADDPGLTRVSFDMSDAP